MVTQAEGSAGLPSSTEMAAPTDLRPVLERVAGSCLKHLSQGGCLSDPEAASMMDAYLQTLSRPSPKDFLLFVAETQAEKHSLTVEGEVSRMQKLLRGSLNDRFHYWTFGPLPGRAGSLYKHCPSLRTICSALGCPAVVDGETSIVHVASINPVALTAASFWIAHELNRVTGGDSPFVYLFLTDLTTWSQLMQSHFAP